MIKYPFSKEMESALNQATEIALAKNLSIIGIEHVLYCILNQKTPLLEDVFFHLNLKTDSMILKINHLINNHTNNTVESIHSKHIKHSPLLDNSLKLSYLISKDYHTSNIDTCHFILATLKEGIRNDLENNTKHILNMAGLTYENLDKELKSRLKNIEQSLRPMDKYDSGADMEDDVLPNYGNSNTPHKDSQNNKTPVLETFGRNLTQAACNGELDILVGREKELERIAQILSRRKKNNPILVGEPGVGKSALAEGLALRIAEKKVPHTLFNKQIYTLDMASIVAGTKYRGQFEERMKNLINEISDNKNIILFIDEIHTMVGAGNASGSLDASNMLKPALARGDFQCIGATTFDEYRQFIEKDGALERRMQKVLIEPTTPEETYEILKKIKTAYEDHHWVLYSDQSLEACVHLSNRYISERCLPDKAIDLMDEVGARMQIFQYHIPEHLITQEKEIADIIKKKDQSIANQNFEKAAQYRDSAIKLTKKLELSRQEWIELSKNNPYTVTKEDVCKVIAMMTGIPVEKFTDKEILKLLKMSEELSKKVIGQNEAIERICKAVKRNRAGLKNPNKPIGSFIFLGPTGVGKTFLVKMLAEYLFDSVDAMIRIDMSEYMEKFAVSRLIGAPPGYVGYEEGGQLTEQIRRKPYSIVLLDEIEKAHPDVFNLLLQVLDDGLLTDSYGRKVDFKNTIFIMTSNLGSRDLKDFGAGIGFSTNTKRQEQAQIAQSIIEKALKKHFAPEFLNRIDDIIYFNALDKESILKIIDIELNEFHKRCSELNIKLIFSEEIKEFLLQKAWDTEYGARPLKRGIQKYIEDPLSEEIIKNENHLPFTVTFKIASDNEHLILEKLQ